MTALTESGEPTGEPRTIHCDLLAVSGGWNPAVHLFSQARGALRYDEPLACFVPERAVQAQRSAGACRGAFGLASCLADGLLAGAEAAALAGFDDARATPDARCRRACRGAAARAVGRGPGRSRRRCLAHPLRRPPARRHGRGHPPRRAAPGCARPSTSSATRRSAPEPTRAGRRSSTRSGSWPSCWAFPWAALGPTTFRPPYTPLPYGLLAGRERGPLYDPARVTPMHRWHVEHGALFEDVGQWKRPWYYPRPGEDMEAAVLRECRAAREGVGVMDASTLGKIDVQGADAAAFLNRIYTNAMDTLAVGSCKYGVMCTADGMVFDDGVAMRLAPDRYLITTTTGNAAAVLDWLEEWLQTEWPELRVHCTSVTEQWATVAVVGPRSRDVLAKLAPEMALDAEQLPVHDAARGHGGRDRRARLPRQLLRRARLRDQRARLPRPGALGSGDRSRRGARDHAVRHRDHARAARREGLHHRRPGHRRDGDAAGPRHGLGRVEEEGRLRRPPLPPPPRHRAPGPQAARRPAARRRRRPCCRRARSSCSTPAPSCRCRCSAT